MINLFRVSSTFIDCAFSSWKNITRAHVLDPCAAPSSYWIHVHFPRKFDMWTHHRATNVWIFFYKLFKFRQTHTLFIYPCGYFRCNVICESNTCFEIIHFEIFKIIWSISVKTHLYRYRSIFLHSILKQAKIYTNSRSRLMFDNRASTPAQLYRQHSQHPYCMCNIHRCIIGISEMHLDRCDATYRHK